MASGNAMGPKSGAVSECPFRAGKTSWGRVDIIDGVQVVAPLIIAVGVDCIHTYTVHLPRQQQIGGYAYPLAPAFHSRIAYRDCRHWHPSLGCQQSTTISPFNNTEHSSFSFFIFSTLYTTCTLAHSALRTFLFVSPLPETP